MSGTHRLLRRLAALCVAVLWLATSCTPPPVRTSVPEAPPPTSRSFPGGSGPAGEDRIPGRWAPSSPGPPTSRVQPPETGPAPGIHGCDPPPGTSCLRQMDPALQGGAAPPSGIRYPAATGQVRAYLLAVLRALDAAWVAWFEENGLGEPEVYYTLIPPGRTHPSHCAAPGSTHRLTVEHDHPNAYYCPADPHDPADPEGPSGTSDSDNGMIILPLTTLLRLWSGDRSTGGDGDLAVALVLAHEFGHHIQHELALHWFEKFADPIPAFTGANRELIADCLAGTWMATQYAPRYLDGSAVDRAFSSVAAMGVPQPGAGHGTARDRRAAFLLGTSGGGSRTGPEACLEAYWK